MKIPQFVKIILWAMFLKGSSKIHVYNYIKYDEEYDADIFLVFIAGERGHLFMGGVDHTETSVSELVQALEQDVKVHYNATGVDYTIETVMEGDETHDFDLLVKKALEPLTLGDKFKGFITDLCYN